MLPSTSAVDLPVVLEGDEVAAETRITVAGPGAFFVQVATTVRADDVFRLVSTYLGAPGTGSVALHRWSGPGLPARSLRRLLTTPPTAAAACLRDHNVQLRDRLEEHHSCVAVGDPDEVDDRLG